jgi:hypothetical protein
MHSCKECAVAWATLVLALFPLLLRWCCGGGRVVTEVQEHAAFGILARVLVPFPLCHAMPCCDRH